MRPDAEFRPALDPTCDAGEHRRDAEWKKDSAGQPRGEAALAADQGARGHTRSSEPAPPTAIAAGFRATQSTPPGRRYPGTSVRGGDSSVKNAVPRAAGLTVGVVLALAAGAAPGRAGPVTPESLLNAQQ